MRRFDYPMLAIAMAVVLAGLVAFADEGKEDEAKEHANARKGLAKATITLEDAVRLALGKIPGGRAVEAELELEGDDVEFEVEVIADGKHREVEIDAISGKVKKVEDEDDEGKKEESVENAAAKAPVSLSQAIQTALKRIEGGKAFEAEAEMEKGKLIFEVEMVAGDKIMEVEIDANTGEIVDVEEETAK